ncbi:hypothetical protein IJT17_00180 [bacterium]|nr:hypothetical protein [bacterium]
MIYRCRLSVWLAAVLALIMTVSVTGCSNSSSNDNIVSYGKIKIKFADLPEDVDSLYFSMFTAAGTSAWGPKSMLKEDIGDYVSLYQVPIRCTSLAVAGYDEDAKEVKYFYSCPVTLVAGETLDIDDAVLESAEKIKMLDYSVQNDLRARPGDVISLCAMAVFGTAAEHYYQDLTEYATWSVGTDGRLSATNSDGEKYTAKGKYRCLSTVDPNVAVTAALGSYSDDAIVDITDAKITTASFTNDINDLMSKGISGKIGSTLPIPTGADFVQILFVANWDDGVSSLLNSAASWETSDRIGYTETNFLGCVVGVGNKEDADDEDKLDSAKIVASFTSAGKEFSDSVNVTVVDASLTGLALNSDEEEAYVGDSVLLYAYGIYGSDDVRAILPTFEYKWSSSNTSVVSVDDDGILNANEAGTSLVTATSLLKSNYKASCQVTVTEEPVPDEDEEAEADEEAAE